MVWTDEQVNEVIFVLLDCAESASWEIEVLPGNLSSRGAIQVQGAKPFRAKNEEDSELALEAFERMHSELYFVQHRNGIMYRVTPEGRAALKQHRQQQKASMKKWNVIGISYSKDDTTRLDDWSNKYDAQVMLVSDQPAFRDNVTQKVQMFREANVDGFLVPDTDAFKPNILAELYRTAKSLNFYLLAANRGDAPLTDDDVQFQQQETNIPTPVTINVHGNQNVIATHGGINKNIANHLEIIQESNPDIAAVLREFAAAAQTANLPKEQSDQLLSRLDTLANEISSKPPKSQHWSIVERAKGLVEYVVSIVSINHGVHYLIEHSEKLMPLITAAFGK